MASPLREKFDQFQQDFSKTKDSIYNAVQEADSKADKTGVLKLQEDLNIINAEYQRMGSEYENELLNEKQSILEGMASGKGIGYKEVQAVIPSAMENKYGMMSPKNDRIIKSFTSSDKTKGMLKSQIAQLLEIDEEQVDTEKGLNIAQTSAFRGLRDQAYQEDYLSKRFKTVIPVIIGNKPNYILGTETSDGFKFQVANPEGFDVPNFVASTSQEILPITASILAGTATLASTASTGPASVLASEVSSNLAYGAVSSGQDFFIRMALGYDTKPGEILTRRGIEAGTGFLIGSGLGIAGSKIVRRTGDNIVNNAAKEMDKADAVLKRAGYEVDETILALGGNRGIQLGQELSGARPNSKIAHQYSKIRDKLNDWQQGKFKASEESNKIDISQRLEKEYTSLGKQLKSKNASLDNMLQQGIDRRIKSLNPRDVNTYELGESINFMVKDALQKGKELVPQVYGDFYNKANNMGVLTPKSEILDIFKKLAADPKNQYLKSPEINALIKDFTRDPSNEITIQGLHNLVKAAGGATSKSGSSSVSQQVASGVANALDEKLKSVITRNGLGAEWQQVNKTFDEASLAFRRSSAGSVLSERFGDQVLSPTGMVSVVLRDEKTAADMLLAIRNSGDNAGADALQKKLQSSYLEDIGLTSQKGFKPSKTNNNYNPAMVDTLWGKGASADRVKGTIKEINELLEKDIKLSTLDPADAARLIEPISINEKKAIFKRLYEKSVIEKEQNRLITNEIVKKAKAGDWRNLDNDIFTDTMLTAQTTEVLEIAKKMSLRERKDLGSDMLASILRDFSTAKRGTNETRYGFNLWDAEALNLSLNNWTRGQPKSPQWVKNLDAVTGSQNLADELIAASRKQAAVRPIKSTEEVPIRMLASETGLKVYTSPISYIHHSVLAAAYGANSLRPLLRTLAKDVGDEAYNKSLKKMMKGIIGGQEGIRAAAHTSRNDADSSEAMDAILSEAKRQNDL
jgi:hypothetical protein